MALDTNWRENTGVFVCARTGNDTNAGTQALPKQTIAGGLSAGGILRIRAGFYNEGNLPNASFIAIGDGNVILDGAGFSTMFSSSSVILSINNLQIQNANTFNFTVNATKDINFCIFKDSSLLVNVCDIRDSFFIRCTTSIIGQGGDRCIKNTFAGCTINNMTNPRQLSFFDKSTSINGGTFENCAFEDDGTNGTIISGTRITQMTLDGATLTIGNSYMPNERFSGTIGGTTFTNCFYTDDPMFNDAANEDYTLQSNLSPLFNNGNIIGCYGVADKFDLSHPAFQTANGATYTNISGLDANGDPVGGGTPLGIASGTEARFSTSNDPTQCFTLSDTITITDPVQWFGQFIYSNGEWIDTANYNSVANREVRLTYGIQFYDENEPNPDTLDNWSKTYQMEVNMPIERDGSASGGLGNGNVDADLQNLGAITFKRFRLVDVTLRNNGV